MPKKTRTTAVRAARSAQAAKVAEIRARGWGITNLSDRATRRVMIIGILAVLTSTTIYTWLVVFAATDRAGYITMSYTMHVYSGRYGSQEASDVAATAGPSVTIFVVGWLLISIADIARRRPRPVSTVTLAALSASSLVLWLAVVPLQFLIGVLPGDPDFDGVRGLMVVPAIVFALGAVTPVIWLVVRRARSR